MKPAESDHALELFNASLSTDPDLALQYVRIHPANTPEGAAQVERVARALMRVQHSGCLTWDDETDEFRGHLETQARAALDAIGGAA
jgi:hypothetical protein